MKAIVVGIRAAMRVSPVGPPAVIHTSCVDSLVDGLVHIARLPLDSHLLVALALRLPPMAKDAAIVGV